jgi:hypothetical protein
VGVSPDGHAYRQAPGYTVACAALTARPFGGNFVLTSDHHRDLDQALKADHEHLDGEEP